MTIVTPPPIPEKIHPPLFPSNPHLKVKVLSKPPFLKIWLEAQLPLQKGQESVHTMSTTLIKNKELRKKTELFYKFKEPWAWPIYPFLGVKHFFLPYTTPKGLLTPC